MTGPVKPADSIGDPIAVDTWAYDVGGVQQRTRIEVGRPYGEPQAGGAAAAPQRLAGTPQAAAQARGDATPGAARAVAPERALVDGLRTGPARQRQALPHAERRRRLHTRVPGHRGGHVRCRGCSGARAREAGSGARAAGDNRER